LGGVQGKGDEDEGFVGRTMVCLVNTLSFERFFWGGGGFGGDHLCGKKLLEIQRGHEKLLP